MSVGGAQAGPLAGRRILVTRRPEQSAALVEQLKDLGATVLELPTIEVIPPEDTGPLDRALRDLHRYDWLVFTSANGVRAVGERLAFMGLPIRAQGTAVASVGAATTEAIRKSFPNDDVALQPLADFRAQGLVEAFVARGVVGQRFLLPVSAQGRDVLGSALVTAGATVESIIAYRTVSPPALAERFEDILLKGLDLIAFASPSSVQNLQAAAGPRLQGLGAAVIGPVTEAAARSAGLDVRIVAKPSTTSGLVEGVVRHFAAPSPS